MSEVCANESRPYGTCPAYQFLADTSMSAFHIPPFGASTVMTWFVVRLSHPIPFLDGDPLL
jgi:hypothetical protein